MSDQEHYLEQEIPPLPEDTDHEGESGRCSPSKVPQLVQQNETPQSDQQDQPEPFNTTYDQAQAERSGSVMLLEPCQLEPVTVHEEYGVQETDMADSPINTSPLFQIQQYCVTSWDLPHGVDLLEKLSKAIGELCNVETLLRHQRMNSQDAEDSLMQLESTKEDLKICQQEKEKHKQKYDTLVKTERETREYYQEKLGVLENQLKDLSGEKEAAVRKHEENEALLKHAAEKQAMNYSKLNKKFKKQTSELNDVESRYKAKQAEVEQLKESLRQREKELKEMEDELKAKKAEVKESERETKVLTISQEKETTIEQLQRCQQIGELVKRLPQVKTEEDRDKITKQINDDIQQMRVLSNRKFISWR